MHPTGGALPFPSLSTTTRSKELVNPQRVIPTGLLVSLEGEQGQLAFKVNQIGSPTRKRTSREEGASPVTSPQRRLCSRISARALLADFPPEGDNGLLSSAPRMGVTSPAKIRVLQERNGQEEGLVSYDRTFLSGPLARDDEESFLLGDYSRSPTSSPMKHLTTATPHLQAATPVPQLIPVYPINEEGFASSQLSHHTLSLPVDNEYLKSIFGDVSTLDLYPLGKGDAWQAYTSPSCPGIVIKITNRSDATGKKLQGKVNATLRGFEKFPENAFIALANSPGSIQEALKAFKTTGIFLQLKVEPITNLSPTHPCFAKVRDALAAMTLDTLPFIEDFRPRNAGTFNGELVDFDPVNTLELDEDDIVMRLMDYYLEWAGGTKQGIDFDGINTVTLAALILPLQETTEPTDMSRDLLARLQPYLMA